MLKGDDAWHMGWKPARKVSVGNWQAPWLIRTMNDSFSTICYTAHKSLIANPEFTDTQFDYTAPLTKRNTPNYCSSHRLNHSKISPTG